MIESISISRCTSYGPSVERLTDLRAVNYIYGANGAGKTTISRVIANPGLFPTCSLAWSNEDKPDALVYNRDFVRDNFSENTKLRGIFTLGKQDIEIQKQLAEAKAACVDLNTQLSQLRNTLEGSDGGGGKKAQLEVIEDDFRDECWSLKIKHNPKLKDALRGVLNDKKAFKRRLVEECQKTIKEIPQTQEELEKRARSLFGSTPIEEPLLPVLEDGDFLTLEKHPILARKIIGKIDVDIASLIQKLGNSDWVKRGTQYLDNSDGECPFCQQPVTADLYTSLADYFDEAFMIDTETLRHVEVRYKLEGERLQQLLQRLTVGSASFLDTEKMKVEKAVYDARLTLNFQRLSNKLMEPSEIVHLEPLDELIRTAKDMVASANTKIATHNQMVSNLSSERNKLSDDVWAFLAQTEMATGYKTYSGKREAVQKPIDELSRKVIALTSERSTKEAAIRQLENSTTSVQPTVNEINRILKGFGFRSFLLESSAGNHYRLCRHDGSDAKETLSEGERSFITFLYFFHLLRGSISDSGLSTDRVVVFDDPVSSLDSDVLFIVSSLIKLMIDEASSRRGSIKQVFILTHNVYFYKEVVFDSSRGGINARRFETFWIVRKVNDVSTIKKHTSIPIKTSYDLLWAPLRAPDLTDQSLQNNMRRVLEHYFRILGGISLDDIVSKFEGEEKLICRSLMSWVHDGSHSVPDDVFHTLDESAMHRYAKVFERVFTKLGHANHYNMMMGLPYVIVAEA